MISDGLGEEEGQQSPTLPETSSVEIEQLARLEKAEVSSSYQEGATGNESNSGNTIMGGEDTIDEQEYNDTHMNTDDTTDNGTGLLQPVQCEFTRGYCTTHKLKGNKMITTTKVWKKKKYGYGFVSSRKTTYSCKYGSTTGQSVSTAKESDVGGGKPVLLE